MFYHTPITDHNKRKKLNAYFLSLSFFLSSTFFYKVLSVGFWQLKMRALYKHTSIKIQGWHHRFDTTDLQSLHLLASQPDGKERKLLFILCQYHILNKYYTTIKKGHLLSISLFLLFLLLLLLTT